MEKPKKKPVTKTMHRTTKAKKGYRFRMAEPSDNALKPNETFLVPDAMDMHRNAYVENKACVNNWEWYLRKEIFRGQKFTLITRALHTYPKMKKTSVILHKAFPVLEKAVVSTINPDFVPMRSKIDALGNVQMHFVSSFDTRHHGRVHILGISVLESASPNQCTMQLGMISASNDDGSPSAARTPELTLSMTNLSQRPNDIFLFFATMVVPFTGCRLCGSMGESRTTHARMPKCSRCWSRLQFPVWYCSAECQRADYARHKGGCGRAVFF